MAPLEVTYRPSDKVLYCSRDNGSSCFFRLRPVDTDFGIKLSGCVLEIKSFTTQPLKEISFMEQDTGDNLLLTVTLNADDPSASLARWNCAHDKIRLSWCGAEPRTYKLLGANDVHDVGDLKVHTEQQICAMLLDPDGRLTPGRVNQAVGRYVRLRNRLRTMNVSHNPCNNEGGLTPASELRTLLSR